MSTHGKSPGIKSFQRTALLFPVTWKVQFYLVGKTFGLPITDFKPPSESQQAFPQVVCYAAGSKNNKIQQKMFVNYITIYNYGIEHLPHLHIL